VTKTAKTKLTKQLALVVVIGVILRFVMTKLGWHPPSLENRLIPLSYFGLYSGSIGVLRD
jgi:hypothetical protein